MTRQPLIAIVALTAAVGCSHRRAARPPTASPPPPAASAAAAPEAVPAPAPASPAGCAAIRVHFAFDSAVISEADRPALGGAADCVRARGEARVTIEGHADDRGTVEYNIALGQRRADAVREYLERTGVAGARLRTISYGEQRPLCLERDEACRQRNRHAAVLPAADAAVSAAPPASPR
jgi:peptidoglycan-associated lipoprotein